LIDGANCQRYAYAVVALFGRYVPRLRSSELWSAAELEPVASGAIRPLDLVLFNSTRNPYGAHVGVAMPDDEVLHLCSEVGRPAVWPLAAFGQRERYKTLLGGLRARTGATAVGAALSGLAGPAAPPPTP
jgi:cell wall-associated NlpC family hydrolase